MLLGGAVGPVVEPGADVTPPVWPGWFVGTGPFVGVAVCAAEGEGVGESVGEAVCAAGAGVSAPGGAVGTSVLRPPVWPGWFVCPRGVVGVSVAGSDVVLGPDVRPGVDVAVLPGGFVGPGVATGADVTPPG